MTLYNNKHEKDNCGFGLMAQVDGKQSHKIIRTAIQALDRMTHRGGVASDNKTGDGCGLLIQKPKRFFDEVALENNWILSKEYAIGMFFFNTDVKLTKEAKLCISEELEKETLFIQGWRRVPTNEKVLGEIALSELPTIEQAFINAPAGWSNEDLNRRLFIARKRIENRLSHDKLFYICSLSSNIVVYKGLCLPEDLPRFYADLSDIRLETSICLFHQRFSTNTQPKWPLAQPFRYLAHNGEINTITGNRNWEKARAYKLHSPILPDLQSAKPFVNQEGSDSSALDNMLEIFLSGGMDLFRAMRMLIPPAWQNNNLMDENLKAFYDFNSMHMEPWDGPAGIVMSDGRYAACNLDRNGLRPARYVITKDNLVTIASEVGIWDYEPDEVLKKGRIGPGELLVIDTHKKKIWLSNEIDEELKKRHPYKEWMDQCVHKLIPFEELDHNLSGRREKTSDDLIVYKKNFNVSLEEIENVIRIMGENGQEVTSSMGDDTPMAVLSSKIRPITDYFRQKFAQVTNPPIDPLREKHVMSLSTNIGKEMNVFSETDGHAFRVSFKTPVLLYSDMRQLLGLDQLHYKSSKVSLQYNPAQQSLKMAICELTEKVIEQVKNNAVLIIISDKNLHKNFNTIPAAMAVGAVHKTLVKENLRCDTNIIVETASARDPHQFSVLLGFGATAIYPYLSYEILAELIDSEVIKLGYKDVMINYRNAINKGLLKIMSKMGISTISSYRCSQLFEAIGIHDDVISLCFEGVDSRISGANFSEFNEDLSVLSQSAWDELEPVSRGGQLKYTFDGEFHAYNPDVISLLHKYTKSNQDKDYILYAKQINENNISSLRNLLELSTKRQPIELSKVEPKQNILERFDTAAMSIGALSPEAHEALAIAMNTIGGNSNSGEGGEDHKRFNTIKNSKIKQVASGRFGVTPHYLMNAEVIQIKVAQGAKPGEGGQLPGHKVTPEIAKLRFSTVGVTLISPPPHHDIYSIEDLAQLIFDLKQLNPSALISVKLVSEPGVGTIAAGVVKANADMITISGYDGGTGASPLSSVKHAGSPWELGLAETQQVLVKNKLRHKIRLQVDGGLKTGLDVIKAAILGAESFGFGTAPMVALGCKYLRICHLNNCATGVATQDKVLRDNFFKGLPNQVINFFTHISEEVRQILANLGVTQLNEIIGKTEYLKVIEGLNPKHNNLNLNSILYREKSNLLYQTTKNNPIDEGILNKKILDAFINNLDNSFSSQFNFNIRNTDRSVGASLSGFISNKFGAEGLIKKHVNINFTGTAGQSFACWNSNGMNMNLTGDANDYVGKGMNGGTVIIKPPMGSSFKTNETPIMGNTCLYGATGGQLFASGMAGERFAVRNSGALAVIEGVGDNACEYMTGGIVVILGKVGINFGAGMTGGFAYIPKIKHGLNIVNDEFIELIELDGLNIHREHLRGLIFTHLEKTQSTFANDILNNFDKFVSDMLLVKPKLADINTLLGHESRSKNEIHFQAQ